MAAKFILIVDDEEDLTHAMGLRLRACGYRVLTADNGKKALALVEKEMPNLILLDVMMPVMDGYTFTRKLNERFGRGRVPVLILTAKDRLKDLFILEDIEGYLVKPIDHEELMRRIHRIFKRQDESKRDQEDSAEP